jgi:putative heme transporter
MSKKSFLGRNWKLILNVVTIVALVVFVFAIREQLVDTFNNIQKVHWWVLFLIIPLQIWNYDSQVRLYRALFKTVGNTFQYRQLLRTALELNFINNVFPSGGVSGISYFGARMRSENVTAGKATLVQIMKMLLLYLSFEVLLVFGLFMLAVEGKMNDLVLMCAVAISTALIIGTVLFVYILGSKTRVANFHGLLKALVNMTVAKLRPGKPHRTYELHRVHFLLEELYENFKTVRSKYHELRRPFVYALTANLSEVLCIYVVYIAFSEWVNLGAIIVAYSVANFAGLVSVLPGGVGIYEALMTTVLVAAGIPVALSLPVTVMYRVLTAGIQLPIGYFFYHKAIHNGEKLLPSDV